MMNLQTLCQKIGQNGCLSICYAMILQDKFKLQMGVLEMILIGLDNNSISKDLFINDANVFLNSVLRANNSSENVYVVKADPEYKVKSNEGEIDFWSLSAGKASKGIGHFTLPDYDPLGKSRTRSLGKIYNKRIIKLVHDLDVGEN